VGVGAAVDAVLDHTCASAAWAQLAAMPLTHLCLLLVAGHGVHVSDGGPADARAALGRWLRCLLAAGTPTALLGLLGTLARCDAMAAVRADVDPEELLRAAARHVPAADAAPREFWASWMARVPGDPPTASPTAALTVLGSPYPARMYADADADRVPVAILAWFPPAPWTGRSQAAAFRGRTDTMQDLTARSMYPAAAPYRQALMAALVRSATTPEAVAGIRAANDAWADPGLAAALAAAEV
jgi:hypothetical protein